MGLSSSLGRDRDIVIDSLTIRAGEGDVTVPVGSEGRPSMRLSGPATLTNVSSTRGSETSASSPLSGGTSMRTSCTLSSTCLSADISSTGMRSAGMG